MRALVGAVVVLVALADRAAAQPADGAAPDADRTSSAAPGGAADDEPERRRSLAELEAREPTVAEVRAAALRYAGLVDNRGAEWARRARLSGLLPRLTLRATRGAAWDEQRSRLASGGERHDLGTDGDVALEARAVWELSSLVFNPAELTAARAAELVHEERVNLAAQVTTLYYRRRRAQLAWIWNPPEDPESAARRALEIDEATAQLDALTGGAFSAALERTDDGRQQPPAPALRR